MLSVVTNSSSPVEVAAGGTWSEVADHVERLIEEEIEHHPQRANEAEIGDFGPTFKFSARLRRGEYIQLERGGVTRQAKQQDLIDHRIVARDQIVQKLDNVGAGYLAKAMRECHSKQTVAVCKRCRKARAFWNRCDTKECPICQPRLAKERREAVEFWARKIKQPKHVILTCRNKSQITEAWVKWFKDCLGRLRRRKVTENWKGGLWRIEVTNEGKGWHLHAHLLVDAKWIDAKELARTWGKILNQDEAIVKVKDARGEQYLSEVTKYTVKPAQMAGWNGEEIAHYILAFSNQRTFGVFGSLFRSRSEWREFVESVEAQQGKCECGCSEFRYLSPEEWEAENLVDEPNGPRPPPTEKKAEQLLELWTNITHRKTNAVKAGL
jgi:hypothetical protein